MYVGAMLIPVPNYDYKHVQLLLLQNSVLRRKPAVG